MKLKDMVPLDSIGSDILELLESINISNEGYTLIASEGFLKIYKEV